MGLRQRLCKSAKNFSGNLGYAIGVVPSQTILLKNVRLISGAQNATVTNILQLSILPHVMIHSIQVLTASPASNHGEEPQSHVSTATTVSSSCTEVCGEGSHSKCCAKVCLAKIYPEGQPERATRLAAIKDVHRKRSVVEPKFFEIFGIKGQCDTIYSQDLFWFA